MTDIQSADMHLAGRGVSGTAQRNVIWSGEIMGRHGITLAAAATDSAVSSQAVVAVQYAVSRPASESESEAHIRPVPGGRLSLSQLSQRVGVTRASQIARTA